MKIILSSIGPDLSFDIDQKFGRCSYLIVYDSSTKDSRVIKNILTREKQRLGISTGKKVISEGAEVVISGNIGPRAFQTLDSANIPVYLSPIVAGYEALEMFENEELTPVKISTISGHDILCEEMDTEPGDGSGGAWKAINLVESPEETRQLIAILEEPT